MTTKECNELAKLNAIVNSIDRVIEFGLQIIEQTTTDDLKRLREKIDQRRQELCRK